MREANSNTFRRLLSPGGLLLAGIIFLIAGASIQFFSGLKGELHLELGKKNNLFVRSHSSVIADIKEDDLGLIITLDSLKVQPHTPDFEIKLWKRDTTISQFQSPHSSFSKSLIGGFSLEPMKIRKIEKTDLRFRLKKFYPNFEFAYEYPANRDTIIPRAPGITLELKTTEGTPIVTLRSDQVNKNTLGDIVSLGASLFFFRNITRDSIQAMADDREKPGNKIVFSGLDHKVFFVLDGTIEERPLKEQAFYTMPGKDSIGFTILHNFPDVAFLKAMPATRGMEIHNPVAHVEIWRPGQGSIDAFLYPETRARKSGDFEIPGSLYKLGLGVDHEKSRKYCECSITLQREEGKTSEKLSFVSGKSKMFKGYRFQPIECIAGFPGKVTMQVVRLPGKILLITGLVLVAFAIFLEYLKK